MKQSKDIFKGAIFNSNNFGKVEVLSYKGSTCVEVRFINSGYKTTVESAALRKGVIKDYMQPSVCGVGYLGIKGAAKKTNGKQSRSYVIWHGMINRCYSDRADHLYPTYIDCRVCDQWHSYASFLDWYSANYPRDGASYDLDKDILIDGNRLYSPETCLFVPASENMQKAFAKKFTLKSPNGDIVNVYNLSEFCRKNNLTQSNMNKVVLGKRNHHKGWSLPSANS